MKRLLRYFGALFLSLGFTLTPAIGAIDATLGGDGYTVQPIVAMQSIPSGTWAQRTVIANYGTSRGLAFFTNVGDNGTLMQWNGTRWRALNGVAMLDSLAATTANIANTETIILQTLLPAGAWQTNDILRVWITMSKSGTTDIGSVTVRVGTAGTTGDTAITGISALGVMAASGVSGGAIFDIKLVSATSAQKIGAAGGSTGSYNLASSSSAASAATTITDASANALYVSVAIASAGATNTVAAQHASIQLITP